MMRDAKDRQKLLAVNLSLAANVVLALLKTTVGIVGHSPALLADGINSTSDVAYLLIVRTFMGLAGKPPDREHPFGHHQLEGIAAIIVGAFVITTAVAIFFNAVSEVFDLLSGRSQFGGAEAAALWVAVATMLVKIGLTLLTRRIGRQTGSIAVLALARDHRNDVFSLSAVTLGIFLGRMGYRWVDPAAAGVVALLILYTGIVIVRESSADLMDILPDRKMVHRIRRLLRAVPGVQEVEEVHLHRIGMYWMIDVTIGIDGTLTVEAGDQIASQVEEMLRENVEYLRQVSVHYHPLRKSDLSFQ